MKRWILGLVAAAGLTLAASTASAQGFGGYGCGVPYGGIGYSAGYGGIGYGGGCYGSGVRIAGYGGYGPGIGLSVGYPRWHDTSHFDYHGPSLRRHGNHFHVQPGHYHLHRSGHVHY
jgi:hypothetical protein